MAKKDCLFVMCYMISMVCFCLFCAGFGSDHWISYDYGYRGLWVECTEDNNTVDGKKEDTFTCHNTVLADGPAFLDLTRTLMCFSLVAYCVGVLFSHCCSGDTSRTGRVKYWSQEIGYLSGVILAIFALVVYGFKYEDYHSTDLKLKNPELAVGFYLTVGTISATAIVAVIMAFTRKNDPPPKKEKVIVRAPIPEKKKPKANERNLWLKDKKVPTPVNQKKENDPVIELEKKEVPVKSGKLKRLMLQVTVVQAARRLQKGSSRKEVRLNAEVGIPNDNGIHKVTLDTPEPNDKYKGIFTIDANKRAELPPAPVNDVPSIRPPVQPPESTDSESSYTSDSSSSTSDDKVGVKVDGHVVPMVDRGKVQESSGKPQRPVVRRSVTTLGKGEEPEWTKHTTLQSPQRPPPPRKTMSQGHYNLSKTSASRPKANKTIPESNVNIYTLPAGPDGQAHTPIPSINYEEVVVGQGEGDMGNPQPVLTKQSTVYQPYS